MKGDSYLTLAQIRGRRHGQNQQYFKELREARAERIKHTRKLNREIRILDKLKKEMKGGIE